MPAECRHVEPPKACNPRGYCPWCRVRDLAAEVKRLRAELALRGVTVVEVPAKDPRQKEMFEDDA